jgi:hypothetical protein
MLLDFEQPSPRGNARFWGATIRRCVIAAAINCVTYQDLNSNMSLLGQQRSLEALLLSIKAQISAKQGILLREQRRLDAESTTLISSRDGPTNNPTACNHISLRTPAIA